ncbi:UNVERIFIED_CONTAM: hypothetical protein GTU68_045926 [Idotea baltica]|nr:hypothetical protein [Idotea baltica]
MTATLNTPASATTPAANSILDERKLSDAIDRHLRYSLGCTGPDTNPRDVFNAVSLALRERVTDGMHATEKKYTDAEAKRVFYLSMEFLVGQSLENNLRNLGMLETCRSVLEQRGIKLEDLIDQEPDAGLGNGGLGRLAACFMDSLASLNMPGYGYGINYEYGLFRQDIVDGYQREQPDNWQTFGSPWLVERPNDVVYVPVYGNVVDDIDRDGNYCPRWTGWQTIVGIPSDLPIVGFGGDTVNILRLFTATGSREFDMNEFNAGDYISAVKQKVQAETISKVLYPSDNVLEGKELRLIQEYFLVACSIRDLLRRHEATGKSIEQLPETTAVQLNDTHPALSVAELMRLLIDEKDLDWDTAWQITTSTLAYTNHTLLPEALERWPVDLVKNVLPRHLQLIFEINYRFMEQVEQQWPGDSARKQRMSIIEEGDSKQVRMCNLAVVGGHSVNGVSAMHSDLVKNELLSDFNAMWPEKFNNKTNGITPRRWLYQANPQLAKLVTDQVGDGWITDLDQLQGIEPLANDAAFRHEFRQIKRDCKVRLADVIQHTTNITVDPDSMFDVQVKRIHEYKRQLLNALRIIHDFQRIVEDGHTPSCPRTYVFAGKAAPGYWSAKQIIKLINNLASVVNNHPQASEWMRVVFIPNYRVSVAERIFPASELSEQISTAGYEASGTGNMKFTLNGALTIGTLDGANIEIREEVGEDNIFIFGQTEQEVAETWRMGYDPTHYYRTVPRLARVIDALRGDDFCPGEPGLFQWIGDMLMSADTYLLMADFESYINAQEAAGTVYADPEEWTRQAILNMARVGKFSSDRTIREYASDIWNIKSIN